jgi:hypothetical protein
VQKIEKSKGKEWGIHLGALPPGSDWYQLQEMEIL